MSTNVGFVAVYNKPDDIKNFELRYKEHLSFFYKTLGDFVENTRVLKVDDEIIYQFAIIEFKPGTDFDSVMSSSEMKSVIEDALKFVPEDKIKLLPITQAILCPSD